uniref:ATP synthase complex subunit 8 n=1 Tax=Notonecta montandoni TaxID=2707887 RepID=A0A6C0R2K2_9HEMI|nr:ATP synthase F0 subunit 8 [Notonecta montandoni]QHZ87283.1 ATP synthase F0 subunit 8 [Notonecta montandoni]
MPQMSPMWWTTLFMLFLLSFLLVMMIMYFNKEYKPLSMEITKKEMKMLNWKW